MAAESTPRNIRKRKANIDDDDDDDGTPALVSPAGAETRTSKRKGGLVAVGDEQQDPTSVPIVTSFASSRSSPGSIDDAAADDGAVQRPNGRRSPRRVLFGNQSRYDSRSTKSTASASPSTSARGHQTTTPTPVRIPITPLKTSSGSQEEDSEEFTNDSSPVSTTTTSTTTTAKRRLLFGRVVHKNSVITTCPPNVEKVYRIVHKLTGSLGGNGSSGPIYGELTMHSMQKMVDWMVRTTGLNDTSHGTSATRFLDVGSGIGKPNLHVAQYDGVEFSCGVEMEHSRYTLGMTCLKAVVDAAVQERSQQQHQQRRHQQLQNEGSSIQNSHQPSPSSLSDTLIQGKTMFLHKNILEATTFDPFTHVYMFSIGFPPKLWVGLSERWNRSSVMCKYLICYHGPKDIIDEYEFDVDLIAQTQTLSMHGSKEGHTAYIYRRTISDSDGETNNHNRNGVVVPHKVYCDPAFQPSYELVVQKQQRQSKLQQQDNGFNNDDGNTSRLVALQAEVNRRVHELMGGDGRTTRSKQRLRLTV